MTEGDGRGEGRTVCHNAVRSEKLPTDVCLLGIHEGFQREVLVRGGNLHNWGGARKN